MKTHLRSALTSLMLLCMLANSLAGDLSVATELVRIAKFDEAALLGSQLAVLHASQEGRVSKQESDCFSQKEATTITPAIAEFLAAKLTEEEVAVALQFYRGVAGRKFTEHGIVSFYKNYQYQTDRQLPAMSNEDMAAILAFSKTGAGNKLMHQQILRSGVQEPLIGGAINELRNSCRTRAAP